MGLLAGLGGGLLSLGGGTVSIPLMLHWLGWDEFQARGTALAAALAPAAVGAFLYHRAGQVAWDAVLLIALPALVVTPLAAAWTERLRRGRLRRIFGAVLVSGAVLVLLRDELLGAWAFAGTARVAYLLAVGVVEGLVAGSVGVSGGPILAPLLVMGAGMPQQLAQGCSLAARLPAVVAGTVENVHCRHVRFGDLPMLLAGGVLGTWAGAHLALGLPEHGLRSAFAVVLAFLGLRYLAGRGPVDRRRGDSP